MKQLIVNADDFGVTSSVNQGIIYGFRNGIITSTSLMVKRPAAKEAAFLIKENPQLCLGLHFDISYKDRQFVEKLDDKPNKFVIKNIENDFWEQIDLFKRMTGCLPAHIDGHHHAHKLSFVLPYVLEFSQKYNIPLRDLSGVERITTFSTNDFKDANIKNLVNILKNLPEGNFELMTHAGYNSDELQKISSMSNIREKELKILTSPEIKKVIKEEDIKLISWKDILLN